mmetsp:Transcript_21510/g.45185  ORF Transcript_21510/g.45185 Transcript_21510/m.45185 type:complete len:98 (-) Transcript_21510:139-432(-)
MPRRNISFVTNSSLPSSSSGDLYSSFHFEIDIPHSRSREKRDVDKGMRSIPVGENEDASYTKMKINTNVVCNLEARNEEVTSMVPLTDNNCTNSFLG